MFLCPKLNTQLLPFHLLKDQFLIDVVRAWLEFQYHNKAGKDESLNSILSETIWYNSKIKINSRCVFYRSWITEGVVTLKDICSDANRLLSFEEFKLKYANIKCTFIQFYGLLKAIQKLWRETLRLEQFVANDDPPPIMNYVNKKTLQKWFIKSLFKRFARNL